MRKIIVFVLSTLSASAAIAQSRAMHTVWTIQPASAPEGERIIAGGEYVLKQKLLPSGVAELQTALNVPGAKRGLPAGTQFIEVLTAGAAVFCQATIQAQKLIGHAQLCLVDSNGDQTFDGYFQTSSATKGLLTIQGNRPKVPKPIPPTPYTRVPPSQFKGDFFVAIERRNFFNIYGRESFMIAFGREGEIGRITAPISFKSSELPKEMQILGARFTAVAEKDGKMLIRVHSAMPAQPFGVASYTTYRFY
jgi:hypothetical protein